jgi:hypothetical protein
LRQWFSSAVVLLVIPAAAAWLAWDFHKSASLNPGACIEGTFRTNDNGSPQICVTR